MSAPPGPRKVGFLWAGRPPPERARRPTRRGRRVGGRAARAGDPATVRGFVTEKRNRTILVVEKACRKDGEVFEYTRCDREWRGEKGYFGIGKKTTVRDASGTPGRLIY